MSKLQNRGSVSVFGQLAGGGGGGAPFNGALVNTVGAGTHTIFSQSADEIDFVTEVYDVGDWFDPLVSETDFVIPADVDRVEMFLSLSPRATIAGDTGAGFSATFRKNGFDLNSHGGLDYRLIDIGIFQAWSMLSPALDVVEGDTISVKTLGHNLGTAQFEMVASPLNAFGIRAVTDTSAGGGASTWRALTDTPNSYADFGGEGVRVNAAETGLEFINRAVQSGATLAGSTSTGALGIKRVYSCLNLTPSTTLTISSADIAASTTTENWIFTIKDLNGTANAKNITIATEGAETIDGASTLLITTDYGSVTLYSDGTNLFSM